MEPRDHLAVVNEPGSANAMAPVIQALVRAGHRVRTFGSDAARPFLSRFDVVYEPFDPGASLEVFFDRPFHLALIGTSFERSLEAPLVVEARRRGIPTLVVLDHWNNYARRFSTKNDGTLDALPDRIAVMDESARAGMVRAGVPGDRIAVTGHPYLEQLRSVRLQGRDEVRADLGVSDAAFLAVFASEVVDSAEGELDSTSLDYPLSDEIWTAAEWTASALESLARDDAVLALKAHPLEDASLVARQAGKLSGIVKTIAVERGDALNLCVAADVVVGLTSMLLIEATSLGIPTISVRPIGKTKDGFVGGGVSAYTREEMISSVRQAAAVGGERSRATESRFAGATAAVVQLIAEMVGE